MVRWAFMMSVLALGLLGCTVHHLGPREELSLGGYRDCTLKVENRGPSDVEVKMWGLTKSPRRSVCRVGEAREYRIMSFGNTGVWVLNLGEETTTVKVETGEPKPFEFHLPVASPKP